MERITEELESITETLPGTVYYAGDGSALFLHEDGLSIIRVATDGTTATAYASQAPIGDYVRARDLEDYEGWRAGWEC